jgi:tripeptide aminopeptidase
MNATTEQGDAGDVAAIMASPLFRDAAAVLAAEHDRMVGDIITLTEIPAPPFQEEKRAAAYLEMLRAHGLDDVAQDAAGNVMGLRRGSGNGALVVVAAHLDTVFPAGTDVRVRREGTKLFAPGVGDDTRSLAVLLAWMRALDAACIRTRSDILFVGDVGEEGLGDLRGMRALFADPRWRDRTIAFISVDSPDMERIAVGGIGSRRYRVTFRGPGGHSYGAFGLVNPMFPMAKVLTELSRIPVPREPRTTYCASVVGGGTGVNAIPNSVWVEIDLRSKSPAELARLEARFLDIVNAAVAEENRVRSTAEGSVSAAAELIGDRPAGSTDAASPLARAATEALRAHGFAVRHEFSSTDANLPMSLGIPAIQIGSGGTGGRAHSLEEWIDVAPELSLRGMTAGLAAVLAVVGIV